MEDILLEDINQVIAALSAVETAKAGSEPLLCQVEEAKAKAGDIRRALLNMIDDGR